MQPTTEGQKVKFHTPLPGENPSDIFEVVCIVPAWEQEFKDGTKQVYKAKAGISPVGWRYEFRPIQTVNLEDLTVVL